MREKAGISIVNRRTFVVSAVAAAGLTPLLVYARTLGSLTLERSQQFQDEFARLTGDATPVDVVTLAELSSGAMSIATTLVKVTIGGCGI